MATKLHCVYCFDVIVEDLKGIRRPPSDPTSPTFERTKYPMFVTWKKHNGDGINWRLRGCIGTFSARDLTDGLKEYARHSAFKDSRFPPVTDREIPFLSCDVSLLTEFERAKDVNDWKVGLHGITIDFTIDGRAYSATFLPEVAKEQGWSKSETISELIAKSGYKKTLSTKSQQNIRVTRYQSSKCALTYEEYLRLRSSERISSISLTDTISSPTETSESSSEESGGDEDNGKENHKVKQARLR